MPVAINGSGPITGVTSLNTTVSDTELGYLDGVTSAIQTQINANLPGMQLITTQTFSGVSSVSVNNCFTASFENYLIVASSVTGSTTARIRIRLRSAGTDATASYYFCQYGVSSWTSGAFASGVGSNLAYVDTTMAANSAAETAWSCTIYSPQLAKRTSWNEISPDTRTASGTVSVGGGFHDVASAYDGFTIYPTTGTFTGTLRVYGLRNS